MKDETYALSMILIGAIIIVAIIYILTFRGDKPSKKKTKANANDFAVTSGERRFETDVVTNPAFSDMECNIFYEDHRG